MVGGLCAQVFPKVFFLGVTSAIAAGLHSLLAALISLAACAAIFFFSCFCLARQLNAAKDSRRMKAFNVLHYASLGLNVAQLAVMIWLLIKSVLAA